MLSAAFSWTYENEKTRSRTNFQVAHQSQLWWDPKSSDQQSLRENRIELNHHFFSEITYKAVPLDLRVLKVLKSAPIGLDLYMFLSWRVFNLRKPVYISWESLHDQLGGQYVDIKVFARDCRRHLRRIQAIWLKINLTFYKGRLCLASTSQGHIPVKKAGD